MSEIIRTWPATSPIREVQQMFRPRGDEALFHRFYFTLGKGKPKETPTRLWWTWKGRILGDFEIAEIVQADGSLPFLHKINGAAGEEWKPARDAWIMVCNSETWTPLRQRVFMSGFRGWRYFDLQAYLRKPESRMRL